MSLGEGAWASLEAFVQCYCGELSYRNIIGETYEKGGGTLGLERGVGLQQRLDLWFSRPCFKPSGPQPLVLAFSDRLICVQSFRADTVAQNS